MKRLVEKHIWNLSLMALFLGLLLATKLIQPGFGVSGIHLCHRSDGRCGHRWRD